MSFDTELFREKKSQRQTSREMPASYKFNIKET